MKQYKLIKEYPGSPKLGYIWEMYSGYKGDYHRQPEYWEEIIEKDYEILSYNDLGLLVKQPSGLFKRISGNTLVTEKQISHFKIHSVKRLSDGKIFTIGDKVQHQSDNRDNGIITKIEIKDLSGTNEYCLITFNGKRENNNNFEYTNSLNVLKHFKQPLFITEDNVEIFDLNEELYDVAITKTDIFICGTKTSTKLLKQWKESENFKHRLAFYSKQKAQEYIDLHKPKYSLNDIKEIYSKYFLGLSVEVLCEHLKRLNK